MMKLNLYNLLFLALLLSAVQGMTQPVPTFNAEQTFYYHQNDAKQPLNARFSNQIMGQLTSTFQAFSLVDLNSKALTAYVKKQQDAAFVLQLGDRDALPIRIAPYSLLANNFASYEIGTNGKTATTASHPTVTYRGVVEGPEGGDVRLMLDGDRIQGFVTYQGEKLYLESLNAIVEEAGSQEFIVYNANDVTEEGELLCLAQKTDINGRQLDNQKAQATCNGNWELEIATCATYDRYNDYNTTVGINNEILGILNNVQSNYDEYNVKLKVVEQVVITCNGCEPWSSPSSPRDLLDKFTAWGPDGFNNNHDEGILFYEGAGSGTVGVAWIGTICRSSRYAVVDKLRTAEKNRVLVAHEMGHNFNAQHDASGAPYIMAPSVGNVTQWSPNSTSVISSFVDSRTCLACVEGGDTPTDPEPPVALRNPENPQNISNGLDFSYYEGSWNNLPDFSGLTAVKSGTVSTFDLSVSNRNDNFGVLFSGFVEVPADGEYTFYTASDDGSQLFIGSTLVVNNDGLHATQERSGKIGLKAGKHALTVSFFEKAGNENLTVQYAGPGRSKTTIPAANLYRINSETDTPTPTGPGNALPWEETFALDNGASQDEGATAWSMRILNNYGGFARVQNGCLLFNAVEAVWLSGKINISDVSAFSMTYDYLGDNPGVMEPSDYIKIEYRYDDGDWVLTNSETDGTYYLITAYMSQNGSEVQQAQTLQVRVTAKTTATNETWYLDNVSIQCESCGATANSATSPETPLVKTNVYPNPSTGSFTIDVDAPERKVDVSIVNLRGQQVFSQTGIDTQQPITVNEHFTPGIYVLEITGRDFSDRIKIIKQ